MLKFKKKLKNPQMLKLIDQFGSHATQFDKEDINFGS